MRDLDDATQKIVNAYLMQYVCPTCGHRFTEVEDADLHIKAFHPEPPKIKKGDIVHITINGTGAIGAMRVTNLAKKGEADELQLEEVE